MMSMENLNQKPSVGRAVHYVARGSADGKFPSVCRAADITEIQDDETVGLMVKNPTGLFFHSIEAGGCVHDESSHLGGTWHWPERV
jgi:hypothetical protein